MLTTPSQNVTFNNSANTTAQNGAVRNSFVLAHFSDPHLACVDSIQTSDLLNKRLFGYLKWKLKRQAEHSEELLTILRQDLQRTKPDHIAITGDLTQLGLPIEFKIVHNWLETIGSSKRVTIIPGNHDTYVKTDWQETFVHWLDYMAADDQDQTTKSITSRKGLFPTLRIRDRIAIIGINTALPTGLHLATGSIGLHQLEKLEIILKNLHGSDLFRILLIHHPPIQNIVSWRRSLTDAVSLRKLLNRYGVELILFGHAHKTAYRSLETPTGLIQAFGTSSASSQSLQDNKRACYYLYEIISTAEGWKVHVVERNFSLEQYCFVDGLKKNFTFPIKTS